MANQISQPPNTSPVAMDGDGNLTITQEWSSFFNNSFAILTALTQSGTTANRPVKLLWTGRTYFDTTLGRPIWYKTSGWVDATGASV